MVAISRNSTEFKFVFRSYSGVVTRTPDLVALMSFLSKMRTGTSDRSAAESWLILIERDWDKGKNKEQEEKGQQEQLQKMGSQRCQWLVWKRETSQSSSKKKQFVVYAGGHRYRHGCRYKRSRNENAEEDLLGMVVGFIAINQFSVDLVTYVHMGPRRYATYATLSLKVWSMREVVSNEMNLHGEVFTEKSSLSSVREEDVSCCP